ncbi:hypothetical protein Leryth_011470 [Lithospermum erythrorhizon]|nr:hypothetical protein Leryth_011470 [Lithospermum erythrorhizon]
MPKMTWSKLKYFFIKQRGSPSSHITVSQRKSNNYLVEEEYVNAIRTKSYVDICHKVQGKLEITVNIDEPCSSSSCSTSMRQSNLHLSEILLQPHQESINEIISSFNVHHLVISYFANSLEAFRSCEFLFTRIIETRANYRTMKRVMKIMRRLTMVADQIPGDEFYVIYKELASFALLKNPLSVISPKTFQSTHDDHVLLLHKLTSQCRKIRRKGKVFRWLKNSFSCFLVLRFKKIRKESKTNPSDRLGAEFDVAAKGVFVLINDFDTISRLVRILSDEMDHNKSIVEMCIVKGNKEVLKEVSKEFQVKENRFMQQLEELEECLYLCILNINRSRRVVVEKVIGC